MLRKILDTLGVVAFVALLPVVSLAQVGKVSPRSGGSSISTPVSIANGGTNSALGDGLVDTCTDAVGSDAYACSTATTCPGTLADTRPVLFVAGTANTGASTFAYCGLAAKAIVKTIGGISTALADNDILAKQPVLVRYNETDDNWKMISAISNAPTATVTTASIEDVTYGGASAIGTDAYAVTLTTAPASLAAMEGVVVQFKADVGNTAGATIAFNGFAATAITISGTALATGDIDAGSLVTVSYDGVDFECLSCRGNTPSLATSNTYPTTATQTLYAANFFNPVTAITTTVTTALVSSSEVYTNTGDGDGITITLLNNPTVGGMWHFAVTVAQTMTIVASAGETLMHGTSTCGTSLTSNAIGSTITIRTVVGGSGGVFMTWGATGTWTCNA